MVQEASRPVRVDTFAGAHGPIAEEAQRLGIQSSVGGPIVVEAPPGEVDLSTEGQNGRRRRPDPAGCG